MTSRDFAYWLQGFFEISNVDGSNTATSLTATQVAVIQKHLNLVFFHEIDPSYTDDKNKQEQMNSIHNNPSNYKPGSSQTDAIVRC